MKRSRVTMEDWNAQDEEEKRWEEMIPQDSVKHASTGQEQDTSGLDALAVAQQLVAVHQQRILVAYQKRTVAEDNYKLLHQQRENLDIKFNHPYLAFRNSNNNNLDSKCFLSDEEYDAQRAALAASTNAAVQMLMEAIQEEKDLNHQITTLVGGGQMQTY